MKRWLVAVDLLLIMLNLGFAAFHLWLGTWWIGLISLASATFIAWVLCGYVRSWRRHDAAIRELYARMSNGHRN